MSGYPGPSVVVTQEGDHWLVTAHGGANPIARRFELGLSAVLYAAGVRDALLPRARATPRGAPGEVESGDRADEPPTGGLARG